MTAPQSLEAKRAAEKVRNAFLLLAAANLVVVAVIMWHRKPGTPAPAPTSPPAQQAAEKRE